MQRLLHSIAMPAYLIVDIEVHDAEEYEKYKPLASATIAQYKGKYLARAGRTEVLEGSRTAHRTVILEFPTFDDAKAWWASEEYAPAKELRQRVATTEMLLIEGV